MNQYLESILARKKIELKRRRAHGEGFAETSAMRFTLSHIKQSLRRIPGEAPRVIAEVKFKSPSAGILRQRKTGDALKIARSYQEAGASTISVLCDRQGFDGTVLDIRRVSRAVSVPVLFKEFVIDELQIALAHAMGASLVLLIARILSSQELTRLIDACYNYGLCPLVEVADKQELDLALNTSAELIGINARDLRSFTINSELALELIQQIPKERIAIYMSGINRPEVFVDIAQSRADSVLIGEALMKATNPGAELKKYIAAWKPSS